VSVVSPLVATYPLFTLALSALFLRERDSARACCWVSRSPLPESSCSREPSYSRFFAAGTSRP